MRNGINRPVANKEVENNGSGMQTNPYSSFHKYSQMLTNNSGI
jgi:hypothetical protein